MTTTVGGRAADAIADAWSCATVAERHGVVIECCRGPLPYTYTDHTFSVASFAPSWAVALPQPAPFRPSGTACLLGVAVRIAKVLPASLISSLMQIPRLRPKLIHITTAPAEITHALEVARPDLYWLVASAWHALKHARGATMDQICSLTRSTVASEWRFDSNTQSLSDLLLLAQRMHVVMVATSAKGTADIIIDGAGKLSCSPRDKMLLAIALLWAEPTHWLKSMPRCAPGPVAQFRNAVLSKQ